MHNSLLFIPSAILLIGGCTSDPTRSDWSVEGQQVDWVVDFFNTSEDFRVSESTSRIYEDYLRAQIKINMKIEPPSCMDETLGYIANALQLGLIDVTKKKHQQ